MSRTRILVAVYAVCRAQPRLSREVQPTGTSWLRQPYIAGMPPVDCTTRGPPITGHLFAATFGRSAFEVTPEMVVPVAIDIQPGSVFNPLQPKDNGTVPAAILSSNVFDPPPRSTDSR